MQVVLSPLFEVDSSADGYAGAGAVIAEMLSILSWILGESAIVPTRKAITMIQEMINRQFMASREKQP